MSSPGGDVKTAMKFGRFFRRAAMQVKLEKYGVCNSACFLVLVGGTERVFGAEVGIHRPYYDREIYSKLSPSEATEYFRNMNKSVRAYLAEMDVPIQLIDRMMSIQSNQMEYLSPREIEDAIDTFAPSHEEWLLAKCGISLSDEPGSDESTSSEQMRCWDNSLNEYQDQLLSEILSR